MIWHGYSMDIPCAIGIFIICRGCNSQITQPTRLLARGKESSNLFIKSFTVNLHPREPAGVARTVQE
jgi:hypothetical protein